jgi:hypothetical protein
MPPSMKQEKKRVSPYTKTNPIKTNVFFNNLKPAGNKVELTSTIISFGTDRNSIIIDLKEKSIKNKKNNINNNNIIGFKFSKIMRNLISAINEAIVLDLGKVTGCVTVYYYNKTFGGDLVLNFTLDTKTYEISIESNTEVLASDKETFIGFVKKYFINNNLKTPTFPDPDDGDGDGDDDDDGDDGDDDGDCIEIPKEFNGVKHKIYKPEEGLNYKMIFTLPIEYDDVFTCFQAIVSACNEYEDGDSKIISRALHDLYFELTKARLVFDDEHEREYDFDENGEVFFPVKQNIDFINEVTEKAQKAALIIHTKSGAGVGSVCNDNCKDCCKILLYINFFSDWVHADVKEKLAKKRGAKKRC